MTEREIFIESLAQPPNERATFLDKACGANVALRQRIERLLALCESDYPLLDRPAAELANAVSSVDAADTPDRLLAQLTPFLQPCPRPGALGRLGHYDVLEVLGQGGCGIVLRALDDRLQRVVAVKVLAPHLAATSPPRQRFVREARAAALVRHDNVVGVYAVEEEPIPHLVMEYIDGPTMQEKLDAEGPFPPDEAARLGRQVALGLAAAHEKGLIHRDVKLANILLDGRSEPRAKLTDFGLARAADDASLTQSGVLAGTPMYMSPEQARGDRVLDHRADLFSLGSVLYTMVAGRPPFRAATPVAVLKRVVEESPRPLREVIGDVPLGLVAVIDRLMEKNPANRFASAAEAAEALATCLTNSSACSVAKRRSRRWIGVAAAIVLSIAGTTWAALHFSQHPLRDPQTNDAVTSVRSVDPQPLIPAPAEPEIPPVEPVPPDAIVVTSVADDGSDGTLRWAIELANTQRGEDTIVFDPSAFADPQTIDLKLGELQLTDTAATTIIGPPVGVTLNGKENQSQRAFFVNSEVGSPAVATIRRLAIVDFDMGTGAGQRGAGVFIGNGDLVLDQVTVAGCFCNFGGGICNYGTLRVNNSTIARNAATNGGAVLNGDGSTLTIVNSTLSANRANWGGGAVLNEKGLLEMFGSTLTANISGDEGGAIFNEPIGSTITLVNTIAADNKARSAPDLAGPCTAINCLIGSTAGITLLPESERNITGESPRIGPLGPNGGPTHTHAPLADSPAIDAGDNKLIPTGVHTDQRGQPRVAGSTVDIGAVESR